MADAPDLGSGGFTVGVQVPSPAPTPKGRLKDSSVTDSFCYCYKGQIAVRRRLPLFGRDSRLQNRPPEGFAAETSPAPTPKGRLKDSSVTDSFCYCYKGQIAVRRRLPLFGRDSRLQNRPPEGFAAETSPAPTPKGRLRIHPLPTLWFCGGAVYYKKSVPSRSCKAAGRD